MLIDKGYFQELLNEEILSIEFLTQGQIGAIYTLQTHTEKYLLKTSEPSERLPIEAKMLRDIASYTIPVPKVYAVSEQYLLMAYIEEQPMGKEAEALAASGILSALHSVSNESRMYGYWYDTTIASFVQHNEQTQYNWGLFLGQMRIMPMARTCYDRGYLSPHELERLERLSRDIYKLIDLSEITPSLLHGDLWSGNILYQKEQAVLIDPAIYFGDREMELAFIRMFDTFGKTFFDTYTQIHPLSDIFESVKLPLYQIYPALVHVALYGESYKGILLNAMKALKA